MSHRKHRSKNNEKPYPEEQDEAHGNLMGLVLIILALLLFVGVYFWPQISGSHGGSFRGQISSVEQNSIAPGNNSKVPAAVMNRINEDLKETQIQTEIQKQSMQNENAMAPKVQAPVDDGSISPTVDPNAPNPLVLDQADPNAKVLQDLRGRGQTSSAPTTPDQRITSKIAKEKWVQEYEQKYQDEYVKQFKENARKQGYDIRVNKDLDVTGLGEVPVEEPIRVPQSVAPSGSK